METGEFKDIYNNIVKEKFKGDYEYHRWFKDESARAGYEMTKQAIERHCLADCEFNNYLEVGPGPGTWTKLFLEKNSRARFSLVDISAEMLKLAGEKLSAYKQVDFFETDFLKFSSAGRHDLFFSSRAIEYFPDKNRFVGQVSGLLSEGGRGFIITKMPRYWSYKIMGRKVPEMHKGQISPDELRKILAGNNFMDIAFYPVAMTLPFLKSARLNKILYKMAGGSQLNFLSRQFCESYCVKFRKK